MIRSKSPLGVESLERRTLLANVVPSGFSLTTVASGLSSPTAMEFAPDGRVFVTQQGGALRVIKNGTLLTTPFVSLAVDSAGERGLLGITFDPNFATNRFLYVYHTVPGTTAHNRITRYTADAANPDVAVAGSGVAILDLDNLSGATNHNGGAIHFGPDGKLYVAVGENANGSNAQSFSNRLGKMLRINADGSTPTDNPYFSNPNVTGLNKQIWALGLRNPFTFNFEPGTGKMQINDVGQSTWEEINVGQAGKNYGWPIIEGLRTTETAPANYADPVLQYRHPFTGSVATDVGIAITGGTFYKRPAGATTIFPESYDGDYFFADYGNNWIRKQDPGSSTSSLFLTGGSAIVDLREGPDGAVYYLERGNNGAVQRIQNAVALPSALDLATSSDSGVSSTDNITNDSTPTISVTATGGVQQRFYVDGVLSTQRTQTGTFSVDLPALTDGQHVITVVSTASDGTPVSGTSQPLTVTIDTVKPTAVATFEFENAQRIHLVFSEDVRDSLAATDVTLTPAVPLTLTTNTGPAGTPTVADFSATALLPDADYTATVDAAALTDIAGNPLSGSVNLPFFFVSGDVDRDRDVDFDDLVVVAQNYLLSPRTFSQGNVNYSTDGKVDFDDLTIIAQRYNTSLALSAASASAAKKPARRSALPELV